MVEPLEGLGVAGTLVTEQKVLTERAQAAVQSLRAGECRLAMAGGVNLMLSPEISITPFATR